MPLPSTAGTACLTIAEDKLIASLVNSAALLAFLGAANETEARARMHLDVGPEPADENELSQAEIDATYPYALIGTHFEEEQHNQFQIASGALFSESGLLMVRIERVETDAVTKAEDMRRIKNSAGLIAEQVCTQSPDIGKLDVQQSGIVAAWIVELQSIAVKGRIIGADMVFAYGFGDVGGGGE